VLEPATVAGRERLRLFVALVLPADAVDRLVAWQRDELVDAGGARILPRENLHVTIAFLGGRPASDADRIVEAIRTPAANAKRPVLTPSRYRETRSVGMVVLEDEDDRAATLAESVFTGLEQLGVYEREKREWLPHVTVLRFRGPPPRLSPALPELGAVSPSEVALYHSVLRRSGAQYEIVESVALGG
jgi:2'-5' RNA ligase